MMLDQSYNLQCQLLQSHCEQVSTIPSHPSSIHMSLTILIIDLIPWFEGEDVKVFFTLYISLAKFVWKLLKFTYHVIHNQLDPQMQQMGYRMCSYTFYIHTVNLQNSRSEYLL